MAKQQKIKKTSDLIFDNKNINRHTQHGMQMLKNSIDKNGIGRSILIDKNNTIIAGNGVAEVTADKPVRIIETNGEEVIAIKRMDIDIDTDKGRNLALADNVISRVNFNPDQEILTELNDDYRLEEDIFDAVYVEIAPEIDYSLLNENSSKLGKDIEEKESGVKKAIQIEFNPEHYEEAVKLIAFWREQKLYIGAFLIEKLKEEKNKID